MILAAAVIFIAILFAGTYNKLQVMDEGVSANWAQVENQLKRRSDLIPNLTNTVKGYATHEKRYSPTLRMQEQNYPVQ